MRPYEERRKNQKPTCSCCERTVPRVKKTSVGPLCDYCYSIFLADRVPDPGLDILPAGTVIKQARSSATHIGGGAHIITTLPIDHRAAKRGCR